MSYKAELMTYNEIPGMLRGIILSSSRFDGKIPASIANLKGIQILNISLQ